MGYGLAIIDGVLGGAAGAGQGIADEALLQEKSNIETLREQRLSQLRTQEHAANTQSDIAAKQGAADVQAQRSAQFFQGNKLPATPIIDQASATYDDPNNPGQTASVDSNTTTAMEPPSDRAQAAQYARKALETGRPDIIKAANDYQTDALKAQDMDRKNSLEQARVGYEAERNEEIKARVQKLNAETEVLSQGGKAIPSPMFKPQQDGNGNNMLVDTHSGIYGIEVPGKPAQKGEFHLWGPNGPDQEATHTHYDWYTSSNEPVPGGIDAVYPAWAAARNKQLGAKKPGVIDNASSNPGASDPGASLTSEIAAQAGSASAAKAAPTAAASGAATSGAATPAPPKAYPNAQLAPDGKWYVKQGSSWYRVKE